jgi:hypothetical protein
MNILLVYGASPLIGDALSPQATACLRTYTVEKLRDTSVGLQVPPLVLLAAAAVQGA